MDDWKPGEQVELVSTTHPHLDGKPLWIIGPIWQGEWRWQCSNREGGPRTSVEKSSSLRRPVKLDPREPEAVASRAPHYDGQANTSGIVAEPTLHEWRVGDRGKLKVGATWGDGLVLAPGYEIMVLAVEDSQISTKKGHKLLVFLDPRADAPFREWADAVEFTWRPEPIRIPTLVERQARLWEKWRRIQAERRLIRDVTTFAEDTGETD